MVTLRNLALDRAADAGGRIRRCVVKQCRRGCALIILTLPRGRVRERYGAWDTYVV